MIEIDWTHLFQVAAAALIGSVVVMFLFALGVRFSTNADHVKSKASKGDAKALRAEALNRSIAYVLFALSFGAVIYGVLLIVPGLIPGVK